MQADLVCYLHAGMIQHDPQGQPAFMHRTAEGKMYPFNTGYRRVRPLHFRPHNLPLPLLRLTSYC